MNSPCFKCGKSVPPDTAVHTNDGKVACPECAEKLGIKVERLSELREVVRMVTREAAEREREKLAEVVKADGDHSVLAQTAVETLDWVLGDSRWPPSDKLTS